MSSFFADLGIYVLLLAGAGFGGISLLGLLIFPDIRSRLYTALRAGLIAAVAVTGAAFLYGISQLSETGGEQYATFLFHTLFLAGIIILGIMIINRQILEKTCATAYCVNLPAEPEKDRKKDS